MNFQKLFTLISTAISLVEEVYPQPKMGSTKLGAVLAITQTAAIILAQSGQIPLGAAHDTLGMTQYVQDVFKQSPYAVKAVTAEVKPNVSDAVRRALAQAQPKKGE